MGRNDGHHHHHHHNHHGSYRSNFNRPKYQQHRNNSDLNRQPTNRIDTYQHDSNNTQQPFIANQQPIQNIPVSINNNNIQQYPGLLHSQPQFNYNQEQQHAFLNPQLINNQSTFDINNSIIYQPSNLQQQTLLQQQATPQHLIQQHQIPTDSNWFNSSSNIPANTLSGLQLLPNQITETGIIPTNPYYELPAGIMVPLIKPGQKEYKPLNPSELRLPLPKFPDDNFLRSIDMYYGNDGKIRDNDGWDREYIDKIRFP